MHSIKVAAQVTGISTDVLRTWERRYGVVKPKRNATGQRVYAASDLARLRLLGKVVAYGHPISRAAKLSGAQLERLLAEAGEQEPARQHQVLIARALAAAQAYRPDVCDEVLGCAMAALPPDDAVRCVFSPVLHKAGEWWCKGELSVGQGHLLMASMERLLMSTIHVYQKGLSKPQVVYGALTGEGHSLGGLLAAFIAVSRGVRCCYLGSALPPPELAAVAEKTESVALGLSLVSVSNVKDTLAQLIALSSLVPDGIDLWLGGPGVEALKTDAVPPRYTVIGSHEDYVLRVDMLKRTSTQ
jgi:MerR family transcriptional regulator, light-induced transcriptional regulator